MKKILSMILAFIMVFSIATMGVSATSETPTGSITINGVNSSGNYKIYRLLDLESYDRTSGAYSYKVNSAWSGFFVKKTPVTTDDALYYVDINDQNYVTWKEGVNEAMAADFAKIALAYAKENRIDPVQSSNTMTIDGTTGKFSNLPLGYYLVDSTVGALCGLTTTNADAYIIAKNKIPTVDKQVKEDSTGQWGATNTADIGQVVEFRVTINVHAGAENYVLHDRFTDHFTFEVSGEGANRRGVTSIQHIDTSAGTTTEVPTSYYSVWTQPGVTDSTADDLGNSNACDFEVRFNQDFCNHIDTNDKIVVYYNAMLNRHAVIAGDGNINTAWLTFGEGHESAEDSVNTKTYEIDIVKTDSQNNLISGAKFKIYDAETGGNEIKVVPLKNAGDTDNIVDSNGNTKYRRARADERGQEITVQSGIATVVGFDNGVYYLEETVAPSGYNKLATRTKFTIADANLNATFNVIGSEKIYSTGSGVHVVNKTGSMLPETGGFGTTMFITAGSIVVLGAGVLLVTKKRMSMIDD